jgi:hypothetical protein
VIRVYDAAGNLIETREPVRVSVSALTAVTLMRYAEQLCAIQKKSARRFFTSGRIANL